MAEFLTSVSQVEAGQVLLRGFSLETVMRRLTYTEGAFLSIIGRLPTPAEARLSDAILTSLLDHGFVASTITAARYIASGNPQMIPATAGGLLAAGSNTLSPEHSYALLAHARSLREQRGLDIDGAADAIVAEYTSARKRLPGFGHPVHKSSDFRTDVVFEVAEELGLAGDGIAQYRALLRAFVAKTGKTGIPINIDGGLAAVGWDLGWTANQTVAFAVLSVLPGLMAHVVEEIDQGKPLRYILDGEYIGAPQQELDELDSLQRKATL
ncbi:citrate/2-methylcitrate synthase [Gordonia rhizosphera]|uniref:citrate synthase (unknown stereospecificity) n=1 Tax=Gordonia rhizosphera NBRC 16068 TaxID=1108045 RepID=K6X0Q2_9ACTN|nr:citrate/2-methylcitrate synthase [Gordonia rhizosphera]GAB92364.1 putative acyltransferase [Gordonia rhizosphera NBRC 16068]